MTDREPTEVTNLDPYGFPERREATKVTDPPALEQVVAV
jgi:hypothetical protein